MGKNTIKVSRCKKKPKSKYLLFGHLVLLCVGWNTIHNAQSQFKFQIFWSSGVVQYLYIADAWCLNATNYGVLPRSTAHLCISDSKNVRRLVHLTTVSNVFHFMI